jgi:Disulfide bond isomerase protein N-terminus.
VLIDGQIIYTDETAAYVFLGSVIDTKARKTSPMSAWPSSMK